MFKNKIKIIFFGTSEFAVPALKALVSAGYEVVAVVTKPDKPFGRKKILTPLPVKLTAKRLGLEIWQPKNLKIENLKLIQNWELKIKNCDVGIVAAYGELIPPEIFNLPKHGTLNIHPSLLPKYRGPSPIQTAILNGNKETGVTIMKVDEEMDHGPIITACPIPITDDDTYQALHDKLARTGADLLVRILPDYLAGKIKPIPQNHSKATFTRKFKTEDGEIKSNDKAQSAYNKIRALNPEPGTFVWLNKNGKKLRLKILDAKLENGRLKPRVVKLEGGRLITFKDFLLGHRDFKHNLI